MHFELLSKEAAKDPRSHFSRPSVNASPSLNGEEGRMAFSPGVVGPMSSSSLSLPGVEKAMERDVEERTSRVPSKVSRHVLLLILPAEETCRKLQVRVPGCRCHLPSTIPHLH